MTADRRAVADLMIGVLAAEVRDGDLLGVGLGTPLAVAAGLVARATTAPGAHVLVGGAVDPDADLATCLAGPTALAGHATGWVPHLDTMGMAESRTMTLQFLRPAQIDDRGNLNTSRVGVGATSVRLPGGLATADVPSLLPRLVVYLPRHRRRALPTRVDVVTGAAQPAGARTRGVVRLVTDLAVIGLGPSGATLESVHPGIDPNHVVAQTGFSLQGVEVAATTPRPAPAVAAALDRLDPDRIRTEELA